MNRFLFAAAIGFVFAATATADPPVTTGPVTGAPVVGSGVPTPTVVNTLTTTPRRMGLFARLRARNTNPMLTTSAAFTTTPMMTPGTAVPAPMPSVAKPAGTSNATPGVTGAPVVMGGTMPGTTEMMT